MNERLPQNQGWKQPEVDGVYFPDYILPKGKNVLIPRAPTRAEILRKEKDLNEERNFNNEKAAMVAKLVERCERGEVFPFPGIRPEKYEVMKRDWEEEPGYATDVDELIGRFEREGMKVVFGDDPNSGSAFILPAGSNDVVSDSFLPRLLSPENIADEDLLELVLVEYFRNAQK